MNASTRLNSAALLARLALGGVLLAHGLLKFLVFTLPGTAGFFASVGFPGWTAYVVAPLEVIAGLAMILGLRSSVFALLTLPVQIGAGIVHLPNGWLFSNANGGWEFSAVLVVLTLVVYLLGDGAFSARRATAAASSGSTPRPVSA
jgi:putative oxidoreductase